MSKSPAARWLFTLLAALCCFCVARSAMADAPNGGYRVVTTTQAAVVLEVGVGLSTRKLAQDFGEQFTKSTGSDLKTLGGLQKLQALNPKTTIPVCETRGDGPIFKGAEHLEVWQSCPESQQALWLIAGRTVEIPLVRVEIETFAQKWARLQRADACTDAACLAANLPKARASLEVASSRSQTSSSVAPTPAAMAGAASISPPAASASVAAPVDQPRKVDAASSLGAWSYFLIMIIVVLFASFGFLASRIYDSAQERVAELEQKLKTSNDQRDDAQAALKTTKEKALEFQGTILSYFMRLAGKLGATLTTSMDHAAMYVALATAHERREKLRQEAAERQVVYEEEQRRASAEEKRQVAEQRAEAEQRAGEAAEQLRQVEAREASLERSVEERSAEFARRTAEAEARAERLAALSVGRETELGQTRDALDRAERALKDIGAANEQYHDAPERLAEENAGMDQELVRTKGERDALAAALFPDGADRQRVALSGPSTSGSFETVHQDDASHVRPHPANAERTSIDPESADDFLNWADGFVGDHRGKAYCLMSLEALRQALSLASLPVVFDSAMLDASLGASGVHTKPEMQRLLARATFASLPYLAGRMNLLAPQPAQASA